MIPDYADMELRKEALATARLLLDHGAVRFDAGHPFRLSSGLESPVHVDARRLMAFPKARDALVALLLEVLERDVDGKVDAIACCTEGQAIPFATLVAERLGLPLLFVRRCGSGDPHKSALESPVEKGWRVLLVEQLAVDGARKAAMIHPLAAAGARVTDLLVLFQYGVFGTIHEHLAPLGVEMHALATWHDLLEVAEDGDYLPRAALDEIGRFLADPAHWRAKAG